MSPYLPSLHDLANLALTGAIGLVLVLAGAAATGPRAPAPILLGAGWGALCLVLTAWGVLVPLSLRLPAWLFVLGAAAVLARPARRPGGASWTAAGRALVLALPLWLVLAPIRPAEPDTWLNLLPNALYLVDYGRLPTAALPPSFSFLPAAPYDTQFASFLGALASPDYPVAGMSLVNLLLLVAAGALIAQALHGRAGVPGWGATACGLLLATLLNPGFAPRIELAAYGETGLAVTALMAAWLFVEAQGAHVEGRRSPGLLLPLGLVLAAMVNVKQSGIGLVAASVGAGLAASFLERAAPRRKALAFAAKAAAPAALLYLLWRYHVATAGVDELKLLPWRDWQWGNIPAILGAMLRTAAGKGVHFGLVALAIALLPVALRRGGWTTASRLLAYHAALFVLYTGFLGLTYVAHFPGDWSTEAHSFFRYETHLSLVLMLALALAARDLGIGAWLARRGPKPAAALAVALVLAAPFGFVSRLRFDLDAPQPLVWDLAKKLAGRVHDGDRVALLLPGDNGSVATMLEGVLRDTPPRRRLELLRLDRADAAAFDQAAGAGFPLAFLSCTGDGLLDLPPHAAALLERRDQTWQPVAVWSYPPPAEARRWQHILSWAPLCREEAG